jgi:methyltransferase (TIGR00027 family)
MSEELNKPTIAARTGAGPTTMVAIEQYFPLHKRIITDNLARQILPLRNRLFTQFNRLPWYRDWVIKRYEKRTPGFWSNVMCRKRYIDDKISDAMQSQDFIVVNLGAGFDTRTYRLPALSAVPVWEVDQPVNFNIKKSRLQNMFGNVSDRITFVATNFEHGNLGNILASHGYPEDKKTFFIWEAVTQYLTEETFKAIFDFLSTVAIGSQIVFTYVDKTWIEKKHLHNPIPIHKTWLFGINPDDVADTLKSYGWSVIEHAAYEELSDRYIKPTRRQLVSSSNGYVVYAERL